MKTHECFMELTEPGFKRNGAQTMYDEEFAKKMELDEIVKQMSVACGSKSIKGSMRSCERKGAKTVSTEISCNSVYSGFDARRKKMILTKLKVEHLKKRQWLQLRLTELYHARELMEAEMEAEKAYVSFSILDSESGAVAIDHETPCSIKKKQFDLEALGDVDCKEMSCIIQILSLNLKNFHVVLPLHYQFPQAGNQSYQLLGEMSNQDRLCREMLH